MKFPKDFIDAAEKYRAVISDPRFKDDPLYQQVIKEHTDKRINPLAVYKTVKPEDIAPDEYFMMLHGHSLHDNPGNGDSSIGIYYALEDIAWRGIEVGAKVIGISDHNYDGRFRHEFLDKEPRKRAIMLRRSNEEFPRILYLNFGLGRDIYLIRNMECKCRSPDGTLSDHLLVGYRGDLGVKPNPMKLEDYPEEEPLLTKAEQHGALIFATTAYNRAAGGLSEERLKELVRRGFISGMEGKNSNSGAWYFNYADILADYFARKNGITVFDSSDFHTLQEIGTSGFGVKKQDFSALERPDEVLNKPDRFFVPLGGAFKTGKITNYGYYAPYLPILLSIGAPLVVPVIALRVFYPEKYSALKSQGRIKVQKIIDSLS